jgi:hypothetical protein
MIMLVVVFGFFLLVGRLGRKSRVAFTFEELNRCCLECCGEIMKTLPLSNQDVCFMTA